MRKGLLYSFLALLVLGIGIIFIINQTGTVKDDKILQKQTNTGKDEKRQEVKGKKQGNESEDDKGKKGQKQISERIVAAVQGTIDYFSNKETHAVAIGDSLTQGVGDPTGKGGYVGILDQTLNEHSQLIKFDNFGIRGNRTDQLLKRLHNDDVSTAIKNADIVLITIGANDIMQVVKENFTNLTFKDFVQERVGYEERLRKIFDTLRELNPDADIYLLGFYNPFEQYFDDIKELDIIVDEWNRTGKAIVESYENITYIPTDDLFDDTNVNLFAEDNFHPNYLGYQRMAKRVLEYLTN